MLLIMNGVGAYQVDVLVIHLAYDSRVGTEVAFVDWYVSRFIESVF